MIKFSTTSQSKIIDKKGIIEQDGFDSFNLVPMSNKGSFDEKFDAAYEIKNAEVAATIDTINQEANNIKNQVLNLSTNLEENYLSEASLYDEQQIINLTSAIKESTATFVTNEQAGQWYGLELMTDVNGKKFITGFDIGAIVHPDSGNSNSYFRVNADRFIIGGDTGDGTFSTMVDGNGEPIPAFSIVQEDGQPPQMLFNGKVTLSAVPQSITKYIGEFPTLVALNVYLATHPGIVVNAGDSYKNTTDNTAYFWDGSYWLSSEGKSEIKSFVFKRSATKPSTPTGGNYDNVVPVGWSDGLPSFPTTGIAKDPVWVSICTFDNKTNYDVVAPIWSEPGIMVDTEYSDLMYNNSPTTPISPQYNGDFLEVQPVDADNGWYNGTGVFSPVWAAHRQKVEGVWTPWSVYRIKGEVGSTGSTGSRGSGILTYGTATALSSVNLSAVWSEIAPSTLIPPINGDQLVVTSSASTGGGTAIYTFRNGSWSNNTALQVHGDAVISGTLAVSRLTSGTSGSLNSRGTFALGAGSSISGYFGVGIFDSTSSSHFGVGGRSPWIGVAGQTTSASGAAVAGYSPSGDAFLGHAGYAGYFSGNVTVTGYCNVNGYINTNTEFRKNGAFLAFTGGHITYSEEDIPVGDVIYVKSVVHANIAQTFQNIGSPDTAKDSRVFGIAAVKCTDEEGIELVEFWCKDPETGEFRNGDFEEFYNTVFGDVQYTIYKTNSIGEGQINTCAANGDILNGDYLCSSTVKGKCIKQDDDIMHNYTVAKALESVVWDDEVIGENGCFEQDGYKCKMIACTYHSG